MGYAGYAPGMRVAEALSALEQALRGMPLDQADAALELIEKLTRNVVRSPRDEKFRRIRLSNRKIAECITEVPGAVEVLRAMGWVDGAAGEDGPTLELPETVRPVFEKEVVQIIEAKDFYKKAREDEKRRQLREAAAAEDPEKRALREKMELDRKEAAAREPATDSKAKKLGDGPNIMRASDIGIGKSAGGG